MRITFLFLIAFLGYGCGAKKLAVENADTLIGHQVNKRLPLYSAQRDQLSKDIDLFLNKEKPVAQEILPVIDEIDLKSPEKVEADYTKLEGFFVRISKDFTNFMSQYMAKLDAKQQKDFFKTLDDENREILKKEKEDRIDSIEERFEMFMGSINSKQKQIIRNYSDYYHDRAKERLTRRVKLHDKFKAIYSHDSSEESKIKEFQEAFNEYQAESLKGNKNLEILKKVLPTVTAEQREHFRKEAQEIKDLLRYYNSIEY
jgi:transcription termination factor NusB